MSIAGEIKVFLWRRRNWRWIALALAIALAGHLLKDVPVIARLQAITTRVETGLGQVQPFVIADLYERHLQHQRGFWFCPAPDEMRASSQGRCNTSIVFLANRAVAALISLPSIIAEVWRQAGWLGKLLLAGTLLAMATWLWRGWSNVSDDKPMLLQTLVALAFGPWIAGAVFWLLLKLLWLLTLVFGAALSGILFLITTFGAAYQAFVFATRVLKSADDLEKKTRLLAEEIASRKDEPD